MDKKEELIKLGNRVKYLREKFGMSQVELANSIGKDQPSINRLEKGNINPSYIYLLEICNGLGIPMHELVAKTE